MLLVFLIIMFDGYGLDLRILMINKTLIYWTFPHFFSLFFPTIYN